LLENLRVISALRGVEDFDADNGAFGVVVDDDAVRP
jgi:hypothetical protein